jgi:hypothetical protein
MRCKFRTGIRFSIPAAWFIRSESGIKPLSLRNALKIAGHGSQNRREPRPWQRARGRFQFEEPVFLWRQARVHPAREALDFGLVAEW